MITPLIIALATTATQQIEVDDFSKIKNRGPTDIQIAVDPSAPRTVTIEMSGDETALSNLEIESKDGVLTIETKRSFTMRRAPKLRFTVRALEEIAVGGSGDITATGIDGPLALKTAGSGDMKASGKFSELEVSVAGSGDISASGVTGGTTKIRVAGSGDVRVSGTSEELLVDIAGSGDVNAGALTTKFAQVRIVGSGDVTVCATEDIKRKINGSGDVEQRCAE